MANNNKEPTAASDKNIRPSIRAQFINRRTYLRPLDEDGNKFETPAKAMKRVIGHQERLWKNQLKRPLIQSETDELVELEALMKAGKVSASGRVKWMGGTDIIKKRASAAFNCSFTEITTPADFVDVFWLLLQGCGVGFKPVTGLLTGFPSTLTEIEVIPSVRTDKGGKEDNEYIVDLDKSTWTIKIGDSADSWAKALGKILSDKPRVKKIIIDLSELRPGGRRLKGYGWLSSGWKPLADGLEAICRIMINMADKILTAINIGDIANWLGTVLSSRRSAQIWVLEDNHPEVDEFVDIKIDRWEKGQGQREQSNNSIGFNSMPPREKIVELLKKILNYGDPGFVNMEAARKRAPEMEGFNPCAEILLPSKGFCVAGNTPVITRKGLFEIDQLVGKSVEIWNGKRWSEVEPYQTGENVTLFEVTASDGSKLTVTANHRWQVFTRKNWQSWSKEIEKEVTTLELMKLLKDETITIRLPNFTIDHNEGSERPLRDAYTHGVHLGDGSFDWSGLPSVDLYGEKRDLPINSKKIGKIRENVNGTEYERHGLLINLTTAELLRESLTEVFTWSKFDRLSFLAGLIDTDGSVTDCGSVRIYTNNRNRAEQLQLLLRTVGLKGSLNKMASAGEQTNLGERKSDMWYLHITDARTIPCHRVDVNGGHDPYQKGRFQLVRSIVRLEETGPSYCLTEPEFGMCVFGNMLTYQCNLMQVVWHRFNGNFDGLLRAQYLAGRANYRQTCVSMRDDVLQLQWDDNQKLLRLCGVSPTGYVAWEGLNNPTMLEAARDAAINGANSMADEFGLQRPRRVTQVQPAGTVSKALGHEGDEIHEGAHLALSRWVFNNVNFSVYDEMLPKLENAGYYVRPNPNDPTGVLVRFPVAYPESPMFTKKTIEINGVSENVEVNEESAIQQLERYRLLMKHYVQHNCSITISYDEGEIEEMADWFVKNWDDYVGVSFLKRNDPTKSAEDLGFKYLPQECVSERMYNEYVANLKPVDLSEDHSFDMLEISDCSTGACPIR